MIPKSGHRFPACAKPLEAPLVWLDASAAKPDWKRSCSSNNLKRDDVSKKSHRAFASRIRRGQRQGGVHHGGGAPIVIRAVEVLLHQERGAAVEFLVLRMAAAEFG